MELVEGETLFQRLRRAPALSAPEIAALASDLSRALAAAHKAGVVHRDLKPANIILRATSGRAVITDFGISRLAEVSDLERLPSATASPDTELTTEGELVGTPLYMAPEQLEGQTNVGPNADVYALGLILYEAATGKPPHVARGIVELLAMRKRDKTTPLASAQPSLDHTLAAVVDRCLAAAPDKRYPSGNEVRAELEPIFSRGERPAALPPRHLGWFALALVGVTALVAGATWSWRGLLPFGARRLAVVVDNDGPPSDAWLASAMAHLIEQRLQHDEDRFAFVADPARANVIARVRMKSGKDGVTLATTVAKVGGRARTLPPAHAASARAARAAPPLRETVGGGRAPREPDADERAAMRRLGTASFAAFRAYQRSLDDYLRSVIVDATAIERDLDEALRADPQWLHAYLLLANVQGEGSPRALATIERATRVGATDDSLGRKMLDATLAAARGNRAAATTTLDAAFREASDDILLGWLLSVQLNWQHESERSIAVFERMHAARPDLQFGADLQSALRDSGRGDEVPGVQKAWLEEAPESEQALASEVTADLDAGRAEDAERHAQTIMYLHGDAPHRLALLCDVLIAIGKTRDARQIADRLLQGGRSIARAASCASPKSPSSRAASAPPSTRSAKPPSARGRSACRPSCNRSSSRRAPSRRCSAAPSITSGFREICRAGCTISTHRAPSSSSSSARCHAVTAPAPAPTSPASSPRSPTDATARSPSATCCAPPRKAAAPLRASGQSRLVVGRAPPRLDVRLRALRRSHRRAAARARQLRAHRPGAHRRRLEHDRRIAVPRDPGALSPRARPGAHGPRRAGARAARGFLRALDPLRSRAARGRGGARRARAPALTHLPR